MHTKKTLQVGIVLILAAVFGGGGVRYGLFNLVVQLASLAVLAVNYAAVRNFFATAPRLFTAVIIVSLALPLIHLIPLPPSIWADLPGRQLISESLGYAGGPQWAALTVNQARTFVAFLGLVAPFTVIAVGWTMDDGAITRLTRLIIGLGLLNVACSVLQVLSSDGSGVLYPEIKKSGVLFGLFANRNTTGIFLVCCLLLMIALPAAKRFAPVWFLKSVTAIMLALGVVLTQSRSSIVLLAIPCVLAAIKAFSLRDQTSFPATRTAPRAFLGACLAAVALLGVIPAIGGTRLNAVIARFESTEDQRAIIWEDAWFAAQRYWPVGAGMATFDEVFQVDESLEYISPRTAGRAHSDYLEIAIEAGVIGLAVVAAWALWIAFATWRAVSTPQRWPALAGTGIFLAIALQSILDYPLRNQTMLCLAAFALLLISPRWKPIPADAAPIEDSAS